MALDVADRVTFTGPNAPPRPAARRGLSLPAGCLPSRTTPKRLRMLDRDPVAGEIIYVKAAQADALDKLIVPHLWKKMPSA